MVCTRSDVGHTDRRRQVTRHSSPTKQEKEDKHQDKLTCVEGKHHGCSKQYQLHSLWWRATGKFIVDGAKAVGSFVPCSTVPWNIAVPPGGKNLAYKFLRMSASHSMLDKSVVDYAGILTLKFGLRNSRKYFHSGGANTEKFSVDGANAVVDLIMRARPLEHVVPLTTRHWRTTLIKRERSVVDPRPHSCRNLAEREHFSA